ncbi:MAG: MFS transporter, partial [Stellaceae bacterium]
PPPLLRRFLLVRFASSMAWQMQGVAVGWYVYALTDSAFDLGLIGLAQFLPFAGLTLVAGNVIDIYPRRAVVMAALVVDSLCSLMLVIEGWTGVGRAPAVFAVIACYGASRAFEQPAMQSWLPTLVPTPQFPKSAAKTSLTSQMAVILGPSLGGLAYALGPAAPFCCAGAMQLLALAGAASLPSTERHMAEKMSWRRFLGGVEFIWNTRTIRAVISLDLFCVLFGGGAIALLPIYASNILRVGPEGLGLLRSAPAVGALLMGSLLARRPPVRHVGQRMLGTVAVYGAATLAFSLSRHPALSMLALVILGGADMLSVVIRSTLVQVAAPDSLRGRVTAVNSLFTGTSNQLGMFEAGVTAAWLGAIGAVALGGAATMLLVALWAQRYPELRRLDRMETAAEPVDSRLGCVPGSPHPLRGR